MSLSGEKTQIKVGLLFLLLVVASAYLLHFFVSPILPNIYLPLSDIIHKVVMLIASLLLITFTVKRWKWNLDDWGFTYNKTAWIVIFFTLVVYGYFWYTEGFPTKFGVDTVRQFLTGAWEELIFTVFFVITVTKYFQTYHAMKTYKSKLLAVFITAVVFSSIHLPYERWTLEEGLFNTFGMVFCRLLYAFTGTFFFGLVAHGVASGSQYIGFPLAIVFYGAIALLNWQMKKGP